MRAERSRGFFGIAVLLWLTASDAAGQTCDNSCIGGVCTFEGLQNVATGDATLSIDSQCDLLVSDIGASGNDGVDQVELHSTLMATELKSPNFSLSQIGTKAEIRQIGVAGGQAGQELMFTRFLNFDGTRVQLFVSCAEIGVQRYILQIFSNGTLVNEQDLGVNPPVVTYPKEDLERIACGILENGDLTSEVTLGSPQPITVSTVGADAGPFTGNRIFLVAKDAQLFPSEQTSIENRFFATGPITMSFMEIVAVTRAVPALELPFASLGGPLLLAAIWHLRRRRRHGSSLRRSIG